MAPTRATSVNPSILAWARERAGLTIAEAAARIDKSSDTLKEWEEGSSYPTYMQLEALAESVYKRPVALFFLSAPPAEESIRREFRTLPEVDVDTLAPDTRYALRDSLAFQQSLRELTGNRNPAGDPITTLLRPTASDDPVRLAAAVRNRLNISLKSQMALRTASDAMEVWRDAVETAGVFVFKRSFKQREVSGFCLSDSEFPIIVVNNSTPFTRQLFTLLHELGHLLFGVTSITKSDPHFIDRFSAGPRVVETACNRFAAEVLVPASSFPWLELEGQDIGVFVATVSDRYKVSREVILRLLLERGLVDQKTYEHSAAEWAQQAEESRGGTGGNYYATQAAYLGRAFLSLAFAQYHAGNVTLSQLAEHLGVKARHLSRLETQIVGGA